MTTTVFNPTRDELKERIAELTDDTKRALAAAWPPGVPGLKGDHDHDAEQRQAIWGVLEPMLRADGLAGPERCVELKVRLVALPDDLRTHVNTAGLDAGVPHLDHHQQVTAAHGQLLDRLLTDAEQCHAERRRRLHAALTAAGLNDDDTRHAIIRQLTGRVTSSNDVTGDEADWIVDAATRVELDQAGLIINDDGIPTLVDLERRPLGPKPIERDWKTWCKDHGVTQKATLEAARAAAEQLELEVPSKLAEVTHPALVAAVYAQLGSPEPKVTDPEPTPRPSDGGGEEEVVADAVRPAAASSNPTTLVVIHSPDGLQVIPVVTPEALAAIAALKAVC